MILHLKLYVFLLKAIHRQLISMNNGAYIIKNLLFLVNNYYIKPYICMIYFFIYQYDYLYYSHVASLIDIKGYQINDVLS